MRLRLHIVAGVRNSSALATPTTLVHRTTRRMVIRRLHTTGSRDTIPTHRSIPLRRTIMAITRRQDLRRYVRVLSTRRQSFVLILCASAAGSTTWLLPASARAAARNWEGNERVKDPSFVVLGIASCINTIVLLRAAL